MNKTAVTFTKRDITTHVSMEELESSDSCWNWINGCRDNNGYGMIWGGGKLHRSHKVAFEVWKGLVPEDFEVTHSCDNKSCVNPSHLFARTHRENMREAKDRLKLNRGEKNGKSILTEEQVLEILASYKSNMELADQYNVSRPLISMIRSGKAWGHLSKRGKLLETL